MIFRHLLLSLIMGVGVFSISYEVDAARGFRSKSIVLKAPRTHSYTKPKTVTISKSKYPEAAKHIQDAQKAGQPKTLTLSRVEAAKRRKEALNGHPPEKGKDRDEYPPAMTREGGKRASVRAISPKDNRGAGACMGAQCSDVPDGTKITVKVTK